MLENIHLCVGVRVGEMEGREGENYGIVPSGKGGGTRINFHYAILRIQMRIKGREVWQNLET